ncbi:hypothetical protein TNCV_2845061 [Trichonephila clavipes]|nr:hypothetical protein TNCV_2845061 [Trichonephila clavipes]
MSAKAVSFRYPRMGVQAKPWSNCSSHQALERLTLNPLVRILGDISAAEFENGQTLISVVVYISSNQTVKKRVCAYDHIIEVITSNFEMLFQGLVR